MNALACLGGLPIAGGDAEQRVLAHIAAGSFALPILRLPAGPGLTSGTERRRVAAAPAPKPSNAVITAQAMSRTAWSLGGRIAWFDSSRPEIAQLRLTDGAG